MRKLLLIIFCIIALAACTEHSTFHACDEATDITILFQKGKIRESDRKEALFGFYKETFIEEFEDIGLGFRIAEMSTNWRLFEDEGHYILTGSVCRNSSECYAFVWILEDNIKETGKLSSIFIKIGNEIAVGSHYPKGIIPSS
jgi:hypothetical protein